MPKFVLLVLVCGVLPYLVGSARAQEPPLRPQIADLRADYNRHARDLCRTPITHYTYPNVWTIPQERVAGIHRTWSTRVREIHEKLSNCPREVIRQVFGPTAWAALRVAECESHLWPRALGADGERGLFQIHPIHRRSASNPDGLSAWTWAHMFDARVNARVAYRMSKRGTDWDPWTCQP